MDFEVFHLLIFLTPFVLAYFFKVWLHKKSYWLYLLPCFIFFNVFLQGTLAGLTQIFHGDVVAKYLNWPFSPFVIELGFANLAFGLMAGIALLLKNHNYLVYSGLSYSLFLFLAFLGHLSQIYYEGNLSFGNTGAVLYTDLFTPMVIATLVYITSGEKS